MKKKNEMEKNGISFQDISIDDKTIMIKIYRYFYSLFQEKKELNTFVKCFQLFIEAIQIISFAFSDIHNKSWEGDFGILKVTEYVRISTILKYFDYKVFLVIFYLLLVIIVLFTLIIILHIFFVDSSSKLYQLTTIIVRSAIDILSIVLYITISEIFLIPLKCEKGIISGVINGAKCEGSAYYLNIVLGIIGVIVFFFWCFFTLSFSFYPFQNPASSVRINSYNDILLVIIKLIFILQNILITNQYLSLAILLLISIFMFFNC